MKRYISSIIVILTIVAMMTTVAYAENNVKNSIGEESPIMTQAISFIVTVPNGGENWVRGTTQTISWVLSDYNPGPYVRLDLFKSGVLYEEIASYASNIGSYSWSISPGTAPGSDYSIRITSTSDSSAADTSNGNFVIMSDGSINVVAPNVVETWVRGTTHTIKWRSTGSITNVKIDLLKNGIQVGTVASSTPNDGSYSWTVPSTRTLGSDYSIRITSTMENAITDTSNRFFIIGGINVISPNGGEYWARGITYTIKWSKLGNPGPNVRIDLMKNGALAKTITSKTPNDGSQKWTIPQGIANGNDYKIRVMSTNNTAYKDTSNNYFSISSI